MYRNHLNQAYDTVSLKETVLSANTGADAIKRAPIVEYETDYRCLRIGDISNNRSFENWGYTTADDSVVEKFLLKKDDIIIARTGSTIGVSKYIYKDMPSLFNNGLIRLRIDKEKYNPLYIYYNLQTINFEGFINAISSGTSTQPNMKIKDLLEYRITDFPLSIQNSIVNILSSFDAKIENNNAIITNLEEQAQAIFKSWFVDFEPFRDEEFVDSELGRIPRNWRVATLKEFFPVVTGKKNANIATENGKYPFFTCAQDISYTDDFSFDNHAILVAGNGDFNVKRFKGKFEAYQRTYVLIPNDENLTGILYYLINHYLKNIVSGYKGSVINYITKGMIEDFKFPFPNRIEEMGIVEVFNTIEKKIGYTKRENRKLEEIRDILLPKLMSGEIRVEEAVEVE